MASVGGKREGAGRKAGSPNKATAYMRDLASQHADDAIQTLVDLMSSSETPAAARVSASKEIIERGFGKSGNIIVLNFNPPISKMEPKDAIASIADKVTGGELPIDDGAKLTSMIEARIRAVEVADMEARLKELEAR